MHVQTASGLAHSNLRSKGDGDAVLISQLTHNPFGHNELVGCVFDVGRQKFYLILLINLAVFGEVTHLGMAVFDQAAGLCDEAHGFHTVVGEFVERSALVIAALIGHFVHLFVVGYDVILKLAHGFHFQTCALLEHLVCLVENVFR